MLKKDYINYLMDNRNNRKEIFRHTKQVWIIIKGTSRVIEQVDDIKVKEVSISDLLQIYKWRLKENFLEEEKLRTILAHR